MNQTDRLERDLTAWFVETRRATDARLRRRHPPAGRPHAAAAALDLPRKVASHERHHARAGGPSGRSHGGRSVSSSPCSCSVVVAAVYVGGQRRVPAPFGPAANGSIAIVTTPPGYESRNPLRHEPFGDILAVDPATDVPRRRSSVA